MSSASEKVAVITGGSAGIGRAAAALFADRGYTVCELSRSGKDSDTVRHITADMCDEASVNAAFRQIMDDHGRIDVLVCNAGWGISGAVEFTEVAAAQRLFDVNFFGTLRCIRAAVPILRQQGHGSIVCLSSVAAPLAIPYQAFYSASKAAVNDLVLALRCELRQFQVNVSAVMPGDAKTSFTASREKLHTGDEIYGGAIGRAVAAMEKSDDLEALRSGVRLIDQKFTEALKQRGVTEIEVVGSPFDEEVAEAVARFAAGEEQQGKVIDVVQTGYRLGERVLRFAKVVVGE